MKADLIVSNASELLTIADDELGIIRHGWLAAHEGIIVAVGDKESVLAQLAPESQKEATRIDATGKTVLPGFVDAHTHLVFGGDRLEEYALKTAGQKIDKRYVGMGCSVRRTRACDEEKLFKQSARRLEKMVANGSTTIECKSGYGLATETELLQLKIVQRLAQHYPVDLISTFLGGHGWPEDVDKERYLTLLIEEMLPLVAEQKLARFCDIWVDEGFFTALDAARVLSAGLRYGLRPKIHAEAYSYIGASDVAAKLHAVSADHLNYTPPHVMKMLAQAGVTAVLTPCTDYVVKHPMPANPKLMIENGLNVAVATNCNPGCWCTSMPFALQLAIKLNGMSITDALRGATLFGAKALALSDRGQLVSGMLADFQIWDVARHQELFYHMGESAIEAVYKRGHCIASNRTTLLRY